MRILHTCLRYPPATGGVETYVQDIVEKTRNIDEKRDVRVLTSKMRTHGPISELDPNTLLDDPIYVQRLHYTKTPLISYPRLQALKYYIGHHKPDIIHGYSFWYQPADTAARYAKKHNIPFIFHPNYYENDTRKKPLWQRYKTTKGKNTFKQADVTVVISPFEQSLIEKANMPVKRFELIPPRIDMEKFDTQTENIFEKKNITGNILLTVSRIAEGKGLDDIITTLPDILKQHPNTNLVIVGEDFGYKQKLQELTDEQGIKKNVHFLGKLSQQDLISAYQNATILVHPSHYEAFGIVMGEALAAKTPVVARNTSAIPFVVPDKKAGLLFNTKEEMLSAITTLLENENLQKKLASTGHEYIKQTFSGNASIKKLISLYQEL